MGRLVSTTANLSDADVALDVYADAGASSYRCDLIVLEVYAYLVIALRLRVLDG